MVDVEETVLADARALVDGVLHALPQVLADLVAQCVQIALARGGREDRRHQARVGRDHLGRVPVRHHEPHLGVGRASASRWNLWCGALNSHSSGGRFDPSSFTTRRWYS